MAIALLTGSGCACRGQGEGEPLPVRWQLVERLYRDLPGEVRAGDGWIDPNSPALVFEPVYREDLEPDVARLPGLSVELVELSPGPTARRGEVVTALVRVKGASPKSWYRIRIHASTSDVLILSDEAHLVRGTEAATFRFTSRSVGHGGVTLDVQALD